MQTQNRNERKKLAQDKYNGIKKCRQDYRDAYKKLRDKYLNDLRNAANAQERLDLRNQFIEDRSQLR